MRWRLLVIALLCVADAAEAAMHFVRPLGGAYGTEDGSSYTNAFDGFVDISGMSTGDTLYVCGLHRETLTVSIDALTVRFDCPEETGSIHGSDLDDGATGWTGPDGNGNYAKTYPTQPRVVARDPSVSTSGTTATILTKGTADAGLLDGQFFWSANVLYIHENPAGHTYEVGQRDRPLTFSNTAIGDLTVIGGASPCSVNQTVVCGQINFSNSRGISDGNDAWTNDRGTLRVQNVYFFGTREQAIHQDNNSTAQFDNILISGIAVLENGGEGVYINRLRTNGLVSITQSRFGSDAWNNYGWDGAVGAYTGDGIDVNPSDTFGTFWTEITDNVMTNLVGDCIVYTSGDGLIARNVCTNTVSTANIANDDIHAINIQPGTSTVLGLLVQSNQIYNLTRLGHGIKACGSSAQNSLATYAGNLVVVNDTTTWNAVQQTCNKTGNHRWVNNTFAGGRAGLFTNKTFSLAGGYLKNNIFTGQVLPIDMANTTIGGWVATTNHLFPLGTEATPYAFNGASYATVAALEAGQASWTNTTDGNPNLTGSYALPAGSVLRRAGLAHANCIDARGRACYPDRPDIGAYQSTSGDPAATRSARN